MVVCHHEFVLHRFAVWICTHFVVPVIVLEFLCFWYGFSTFFVEVVVQLVWISVDIWCSCQFQLQSVCSRVCVFLNFDLSGFEFIHWIVCGWCEHFRVWLCSSSSFFDVQHCCQHGVCFLCETHEFHVFVVLCCQLSWLHLGVPMKKFTSWSSSTKLGKAQLASVTPRKRKLLGLSKLLGKAKLAVVTLGSGKLPGMSKTPVLGNSKLPSLTQPSWQNRWHHLPLWRNPLWRNRWHHGLLRQGCVTICQIRLVIIVTDCRILSPPVVSLVVGCVKTSCH